MTKNEMKKVCVGCRDDFYNGKNGLGVESCWGLRTAKLSKRKLVHINDVPPWNHTPMKTFQCYRPPKHVNIPASVTC